MVKLSNQDHYFHSVLISYLRSNLWILMEGMMIKPLCLMLITVIMVSACTKREEQPVVIQTEVQIVPMSAEPADAKEEGVSTPSREKADEGASELIIESVDDDAPTDK